MTDVHMPGDPDGLELSRLARDACSDCAIVVVSGRAVPAHDELPARARYVPKPYRGEDVIRLVQERCAPVVQFRPIAAFTDSGCGT